MLLPSSYGSTVEKKRKRRIKRILYVKKWSDKWLFVLSIRIMYVTVISTDSKIPKIMDDYFLEVLKWLIYFFWDWEYAYEGKYLRITTAYVSLLFMRNSKGDVDTSPISLKEDFIELEFIFSVHIYKTLHNTFHIKLSQTKLIKTVSAAMRTSSKDIHCLSAELILLFSHYLYRTMTSFINLRIL